MPTSPAHGSALSILETIKLFDQLLEGANIITPSHVASSALTQKGSIDNVLQQIVKTLEQYSFDKIAHKYAQILELAAEITVQIDDNPIFGQITFPTPPNLGHNNKENIREIVKYVSKLRAIIQPQIDKELAHIKNNEFISLIEKKRALASKGFFYEFTDGDVSRIQQLINELREQITGSQLYEEKHKARLLKRLESLQSEIHKKMSDVDKFWGLLGDAGVAIGKFGTDAKPIVDRIKELTQIVWRTQSHAEQLPSSCENPLLEKIISDEK